MVSFLYPPTDDWISGQIHLFCFVHSDKNGSVSESKHIRDSEPEIVSTSLVTEVREETNVEAAPVIECSSSVKSSGWEPEDTDAPGDFKCTPWHPHEKFGHTRDVSFQHPIKIYFGARFGSCKEIQKYRVYRNSHLIVDTSQEITDVPYGDYFTVEGRWDVENEGNDSKPGCVLRVYINLNFSKKTMWKGKIVQSTVEECREAYAIWIDLAHELLKQKNLEKEEGGVPSNLISSGQVQPEKLANTTQQQRVETSPSELRVSQIVPDLMDTNHRVNAPPQGIVGEVVAGSFLRDTVAKFSTSLKHQSTSSLLLVISIAVILLLMQISILVLLSRPQRIHVIPQQGCMSTGMSESRGEVLASINKQIKYLKEEMHLVETLLEKMRNEHSQIKGKLRDLELFRNQRF
ncbi:hypothetical protein MIMGU_mgv1a007573mg [Erythranthe guttata]|uniref:VASt domain-containing protein n=1 Tax=Erythranthe guttata TaxID=4155 RepID=A0A022QVF5_ERYGU|nr:hypothetical protein MIMGU_mgv1a007573mg [Erythranthe guttata]